MSEKVNTGISLKLAFREIRFHKVRSLLTALSAMLVAVLFSTVLFLATAQAEGYEHQLRSYFGTQADILYRGITGRQAETLAEQRNVKNAAWYQAVGTVNDGETPCALASYSKAYAETVEAVPTRGRLPEKEGEAAMDVLSAYRLGGTSKVGDTFSISWTDTEGNVTEKEYTLTGTWDSDIYPYIIWISGEEAEKYLPAEDAPAFTAGVELYRTGKIEEKAEKLAEEAGIERTQYSVNSVFNESSQETLHRYADPTRFLLLFVFVCGFFIFFSVFQMSTELDVRFYSRMKTLGMTPLEMRRVIYYWAGLLTAVSVPAGWLLGGVAAGAVARTFAILGTDRLSIDMVFRWEDLLFIFLAVFFMFLLGAALPAWKISRLSPAAAVRLADGGRADQRAGKKKAVRHRRGTPLRMALDGMLRWKWRMLPMLGTLLFVSVISCFSAVYVDSFDVGKYISGKFSFDYLVKGDGQEYTTGYDEKDDSLTDELYRQLKEAVGGDQISRISYAQTEIVLGEKLWKDIIAYYEENLGYYRDMYQYMDFDASYEKLKNERRMTVAVYGVEQEYMRALTSPQYALTGEYDREKFEQEAQVYVSGVNKNAGDTGQEGYYQPLPGAGEDLVIDGTEYTVMGTAGKPGNSLFVMPQEPLYIACYMSLDQFLEKYPERQTVELCISADGAQGERVSEILEDYQEENGYNYYILTSEMYYDGGRSSLWTVVGTRIIVSIVLAVTALLGYANMTLHRTLARKREFAVYRSLGMSRAGLGRLLILENLIFAAVTAAIIYPVSAWVAGPFMKRYLEENSGWAFTHHFTLFPVHALILILAALSVLISCVSVHVTEKAGIAERLDQEE